VDRRQWAITRRSTSGVQHQGYGENWEELGDMWSLRPVFLLSWALMEDPYGPRRDEFMQDETGDDEQASVDRHCDEARAGIAHVVPSVRLGPTDAWEVLFATAMVLVAVFFHRAGESAVIGRVGQSSLRRNGGG